MDRKVRDTQTRLGDISYQLSKVVDELRIIREFIYGKDLNVDEDYFNQKYKEKYGKSNK